MRGCGHSTAWARRRRPVCCCSRWACPPSPSTRTSSGSQSASALIPGELHRRPGTCPARRSRPADQCTTVSHAAHQARPAHLHRPQACVRSLPTSRRMSLRRLRLEIAGLVDRVVERRSYSPYPRRQPPLSVELRLREASMRVLRPNQTTIPRPPVITIIASQRHTRTIAITNSRNSPLNASSPPN